MKTRTGLVASTIIAIAFQSLGQSTYEPYTFTTLAGGGGFVSVDVVISGPEGFGDWPRTVRAGANGCLRLNGTLWPVSEARRALCLQNGWSQHSSGMA